MAISGVPYMLFTLRFVVAPFEKGKKFEVRKKMKIKKKNLKEISFATV